MRIGSPRITPTRALQRSGNSSPMQEPSGLRLYCSKLNFGVSQYCPKEPFGQKLYMTRSFFDPGIYSDGENDGEPAIM